MYQLCICKKIEHQDGLLSALHRMLESITTTCHHLITELNVYEIIL
jgi:hypothetical protein